MTAPSAVAPLWSAEVTERERLSPSVMAVRLALDGATTLRYRAGQYVRVHLRDGRRRDLSMAHACRDDNRLELWVRYAGGPFTAYVFEQLAPGDRWCIEAPLGASGLAEERDPLLIVAGGTGIAPARAMTQALGRHQPERRAVVICGARERSELLCHAELERWARAGALRSYYPVLAETDSAWRGAVGTPDAMVARAVDDLARWVAHVFGPPPMVDAVARELRARGVSGRALRADAFTPGALDLDAQ